MFVVVKHKTILNDLKHGSAGIVFVDKTLNYWYIEISKERLLQEFSTVNFSNATN